MRAAAQPRFRRGAPLRGFTLLELLVAIAILAMISVIAWRGLDSLVATRERLAPEAADIRAVLVTFGQFERDLAQIPNPTLFALRTLPVKVRSTAEQGQYVEVLRLSPDAGSAATTLQFVTWRVQDNTLIRAISPTLTRVREVGTDEMSNTPLLGAVKAMRVRVWRGTEWQVPSPLEAEIPLSPGAAVPLATGLEIEIERNDGRRLRRVMLVG